MNIIQAALADLWQKARAVVTQIEALREENGQLRTRVEELELTLRTMESQLTQKEQRIDAQLLKLAKDCCIFRLTNERPSSVR
jgi:cell division protein FtsB